MQKLVPDFLDYDIYEEDLNLEFPLDVFDERVIEFLNDVAKQILRDTRINKIPPITALAFWMRKSNIRAIVKENEHLKKTTVFVSGPLGNVFHICPSNVDTMFLYSLAISMLMGNRNILRISERVDDPAIYEIFAIINQVLQKEEHNACKDFIWMYKYGHEDKWNTAFSKLAQARIIWGGDQTVKHFKQITVNPRSKDLVFADRVSLSIIKADHFISASEENKQTFVKLFYNDAYTFDQKGCSSPQSIFVLHDGDISEFIEDFGNRLGKLAEQEYNHDDASMASLKFNQLASDAIDSNITSYKNHTVNLLLAKAAKEKTLHSCGAGYFYLYQLESLRALDKYINPQIQTITYYGLSDNELNSIVDLSKGKGVDRIVPVGQGLNFHYIWDGYNLPYELCNLKSVIK